MARMGLCSPGIPGWGAVAGMGLAKSAARNSGPLDIFVADKGAVGHQAGDSQSQVGVPLPVAQPGPCWAFFAFPEKQTAPGRCMLQLFGNL